MATFFLAAGLDAGRAVLRGAAARFEVALRAAFRGAGRAFLAVARVAVFLGVFFRAVERVVREAVRLAAVFLAGGFRRRAVVVRLRDFGFLAAMTSFPSARLTPTP